jgi:hypothetical protein
MKSRFFILYAFALLLCVGCKTQELATCDEVTQTSDKPWLAAIVQKGESSQGQFLQSIDKITYTIDDSETTYTGFDVRYETVEYIYDCDGETVVYYGGTDGCQGACEIKILSRKNIYFYRNNFP